MEMVMLDWICQHDQNRTSGIDIKSDLTVNSSQEILNMILLCLESDLELNTKIIEYILIFPMTIYTPSYNQRFKSYKFWKLTELLKFRSG
jgi:hypothetical protein